jgi:hypothetical protein
MEYLVLKTEFILILISVLPAVSKKRFHPFEPTIPTFQLVPPKSRLGGTKADIPSFRAKGLRHRHFTLTPAKRELRRSRRTRFAMLE